MSSFSHLPVLCREVVDAADGARRILDCTIGGGGHAEALLLACKDAHLIAIDRDAHALAAARARLQPFAARVAWRPGRFASVAAQLAEDVANNVCAPFDLVLADFGVSSHQLDVAARGFSFRNDGPLDMRMGQNDGETAQQLLERLSADALADILYRFGEERRSRPIARAIVADKPKTTGELAAVVRRILGPSKRGRIDPATRTFQAIRMAVNDELGEIERWLALLPRLLRIGGKAMAITFHSLEDRLVKRAFVGHKTPCVCPPVLPRCVCQPTSPWVPIPKKGLVASAAERQRNPRATSATLRIATRVL